MAILTWILSPVSVNAQSSPYGSSGYSGGNYDNNAPMPSTTTMAPATSGSSATYGSAYSPATQSPQYGSSSSGTGSAPTSNNTTQRPSSTQNTSPAAPIQQPILSPQPTPNESNTTEANPKPQASTKKNILIAAGLLGGLALLLIGIAWFIKLRAQHSKPVAHP